ncbi:MAG: PorP/SprF family type IX secretion system membrane protein [Chitinophagaceae bacterium]|nr:PorP/SprF family type IX secretion system membrane protein [Chitinophagaceae bacterium]
MLKKLFKSTLVLLTVLFSVNTQAQVDPHFSQYYVYPQWLNPALTGVMDGDYRVAAIYRSQWTNIDNGFVSIGVAGEIATSKNLNFGVGLFQQSAGNGGYKYFTPYASVAYTGIKFGKQGTHHITIGINGGVINRRFDLSKFKYGNQYNPIVPGGFDPSILSNEVILNPSQTALDLGMGILYFDATPYKKSNAFVGFSVAHLTQPTDKFTSNSDARVPMRFTLHGGLRINLSERVSLTPNALYLKQGTAEEKMIGAYAQIKGGEGFDFLCGANYRFKDALVPFAGFYYKDFVLGLSYDANTSDLGRMAGATNSFELSLSFTGKTRRSLSDQPFICPRL